MLSPLQLHTAQNVQRSRVSCAQSCYFHTLSGSIDTACPYSRVEFLSLHWPCPVPELLLCAKKLKINTGDLCFSIGAVTEKLAAVRRNPWPFKKMFLIHPHLENRQFSLHHVCSKARCAPSPGRSRPRLRVR